MRWLETVLMTEAVKHVKDSNMKFYRYDNVTYSVIVDVDADLYASSGPKLVLYEYTLHSETPKGYWIGVFGGKDKWVSKTSRKRYAYPTKEEALEAFLKRKERQISILKGQLATAETAHRLAENEKHVLAGTPVEDANNLQMQLEG